MNILNKHILKITKGSFVHDMTKLVGGTTASQIVMTLTTPFISRIYTPADFGGFAVFFSLLTIPSIIVCFRYEMTIPLSKNTDEEVPGIYASALSAIAVTSLLFIILKIFGEKIAEILKTEIINDNSEIFCGIVLLNGLILIANNYHAYHRNFGIIAYSLFCGTVVSAGLRIVLGTTVFNSAEMLIFAHTIGVFITSVILLAPLKNQIPTYIRRFSFNKTKRHFIKFRKFPLIDTWGELTNTISWQVAPIMFSVYFEKSILGHYALAFRFIQLPMQIIGTSISKVLYPKLIASNNTATKSFHQLKKLILTQAVISITPCVLLFFYGKELFEIVFGSQWADSGIYASILSPWLFFWFISSPASVIFSATQNQGQLFIIQLLIFATRFTSIYIGCQKNDIILALHLFSLTGVFCYIILLICSLKLSTSNAKQS